MHTWVFSTSTSVLYATNTVQMQENMGPSSEHGDLDFDMDLPEVSTNGGVAHVGPQRQLLPTPKGLQSPHAEPDAAGFVVVQPGPLVCKLDQSALLVAHVRMLVPVGVQPLPCMMSGMTSGLAITLIATGHRKQQLEWTILANATVMLLHRTRQPPSSSR